MTAYALMTGQTVPSNAANGPAPAQVVVAGGPRRSTVRFSLTGGVGPAQASVWARTGTTPYGYTEDIPLLVMRLGAGGAVITQDLPLNLAYMQSMFANLDMIDRSQKVAASVTLTV